MIRTAPATPPTETHIVFWALPANPTLPWCNETRLGATAHDARAEIAERVGGGWSVDRVVRMDPATGACADVTKSLARALWLAADWVDLPNAREIDEFVTGFGFPSALDDHRRVSIAYRPAGSINGRSHDGARL